MKRTFFKKCISRTLRILFYLLPIKNNRIVMSNFAGKGYGDNPKYIAEALLRQKHKYEIYWLINSCDAVFPEDIIAIPYGSIKAYYMLSTAHIWVDNVRYAKGVKKKKAQYYIQTWHGSFSQKRIEADAEEKLKQTYVRDAKMDGSITNLLLSNSRMQTEEFKNNFWYSGEILEKGYPRNDVLINCFTNDKISYIKKEIGIEDKHLVLFAPTFREDGNQTPYLIDFPSLLESCKAYFGEDTVLLIRLHPNVSNTLDIMNTKGIIDVSRYSDMQELLLVSEMLITDYSSSLYDFMIIKDKIVIFATDIEQYIESRGLKDIFFELPFPITRTMEELKKTIEDYDKYEKKQEIDAFRKKYDSFDSGIASKSVAERIESMVFGGESATIS